jgi:hypothetical protein
VSWGTPSAFNEALTTYIAVSSLSANDFVVAYRDDGNLGHGTVITGTVSGGSVSWGTAVAFNEASTEYIVITGLSVSDFVVAYQDKGNSDYGTLITGTVGGTTVTLGTEVAFNEASTRYVAIASLSASDFAVAYQDAGNSDYGTLITGTVGGTTVGLGTESVFNAATTSHIAVSGLSADDLVVAYRDGGNLDYGLAITGNISEGVLSWGTASVFNEGATSMTAISRLSASDFVVAYRDEGNLKHGTAIVGTVSGGVLSWSGESVFNAAATHHIGIGSLSATDLVIAYQDEGNSFYGTAIVGSRIGRRPAGIAKTSASGGETVTAIISGVSDVHSGLVSGEVYYLQADGSLGLARTADGVGLAISETELILDQLW